MTRSVARRPALSVLLSLLFLFAAPLVAAASPVAPATPAPTTLNKDKPFKAVAAAPGKVAPGETFLLRYTVYILDKNHYVYKERMSLKLEPAAGLTYSEVKFSPEPEKKYDSFEARDMEIYHNPVTLYVETKVDPKAAAGPRTVKAKVKYQGCNPTVCFMPTKEPFEHVIEVGSGSAAAPTGGSDATGTAAASTGGTDTAPAGASATLPTGGTEAASASAPAPAGSAEAAPAGSRDAAQAVAVAPAAAGSTSAGSEPAAVQGSDPVDAEEGVEAAPAPAVASAGGGPGGAGAAPAGGVGITSLLGDGANVDIKALIAQYGLLPVFLIVFLLGMVASFTPCVYPIIPITLRVLGARQATSKLHGFSLALVYVLGLSLVYTALGVTAASTGALFGSIMQNKWVVGSIALIFIALGFATLGAFNVGMPASVSSRLSGGVPARGYPGIFLMGAVAGLVASPCVGPLILSLLVFIAQSKDLVLGSALMFTFALGMGQLFLLLGTFAVALPKSGPWMDVVKGGLAIIIFGAGLYYLKFVVPEGYYELLLGVSALIGGTYVGAFHVLTEESGHGQKLQKVAGVLFVVIGVYSLLGGLVSTGLFDPGLARLLRGHGQTEVASGGIVWEPQYTTAMRRAQDAGRPVMLDFTAEWCGACKELERYTYTDPRVVSAAREFVTIKVDGTNDSTEFQSLQNQYGVKGLPTIMFLTPDGRPQPELTITGFVPAEEFLQRLCRVQGPQVARLVNVCRG